MNDLVRTYPQSIEAERALLCSLFLDNSKMADVTEIVDSADFFDSKHSAIFDTLKSLYLESAPFDLITTTNTLKEKGLLESAGGTSYIVNLIDYLPAPANAVYYAQIIKKKSILRSLISAGTEIANMCYEEPEDIEDVLNIAEKKIFDISSKKIEKYHSVEGMMDDTMEYLEGLRSRQNIITGIPTGFSDLDSKTNGLQNGDLIILAGRPSMGKTALAVNIAINSSIEHQYKIGIFSLEMTATQIVLRMISSISGIDFYRIRTGFIKENEWNDSIMKTLDKLKRSKIYIDDSSFMTSTDIRTKARKMKLEKDIDMIIVDYLQLLQGKGKENRTQEISEISRSLKILAKELNVPIIALSQLNRGVELREDKRPVMADLRESGSIEQDADIVMFIYRDEVYNKNKEHNKGKAEIIISKQRNGPIGTVELQFTKEIATFRNLQKQEFTEKTI